LKASCPAVHVCYLGSDAYLRQAVDRAPARLSSFTMTVCRKRAHPRRRRRVLRRRNRARPLLTPLHRLYRLLRASTACSACSTSLRYYSAKINHVGVLLHHSKKPRACPGTKWSQCSCALRSCSAGRRSMCSRRSAPPACPTTSTRMRYGNPSRHMICCLP
jgi:hypothetical protein